MADNIAVLPSPDVTALSVATDDVGGVHFQEIKIRWGPDGTVTRVDNTAGNRLPVGGDDIEAMAASLDDILTKLNAFLTVHARYATANSVVADGQTLATAGVDIRGYQATSILIPNGFDGSVIRFQVSLDGTNYFPLYDSTNARVEMTVAADRVYPLWMELSGLGYLKVDCATAQTGGANFLIQLSSLR